MKTNYSPKSLRILCAFFIIVTINLSCNKDDELMEDALSNPATEDGESLDIETFLEQSYLSSDKLPQMGFELRTAVFPLMNQSSKSSTGNTEKRTFYPSEKQKYSYLSYDLSAIDSVGGTIQAAKLQFTAVGDEENGAVYVFKGPSDNESQKALSNEEDTEQVKLIGELKSTFSAGEEQGILLEKSQLHSEKLTLIIPDIENGNQILAKTNSQNTPVLIVNYFVPLNAITLPEDLKTVQKIDTKVTDSGKGGLQVVNAKSSSGNRPPDSRPSASTVSGNAPLKVQFGKGRSSDDKGIASYKWYFRDGTTSTDPNPSHTFTKPGTYKVILSITDEEGLENGRIIIVNVRSAGNFNKPPDSRPSASTVLGSAPLKVQFGKGNSSDDKGIATYKWYFMDGTTATGPNPTHTFTKPGTYKVILSVTDEEGLENGRIIIITVRASTTNNRPPDSRPSASTTSGDAPLKVQFGKGKSSDDKGIASYKWYFMDGTTSSEPNPSHTFTKPGTYKVILSIKDEEGLENGRIIIIKVTGNGSSEESDDNDDSTNTGSDGSANSGNNGGSGNSGGSESNENPSNGIKASSFGYDVNDATKALKAAILSSHSTIIVDKQSGDWVVSSLYLNRVRNKTIIFEKGVVLRAKRGAFGRSDRLFQLVNSDNVEVQGYGAKFVMNKSEYSGQQNHAIAIVNSSNITVKGLSLTGAGGDGIYVSRHNDGEYCRNITVDGVVSTGNQRQGMTVVSVDGLQVRNSTFSNTSGESPSAGIDFEPESTRDRLTNIIVSNCTFKDNHGPGIMFAVNKVNSSSVPLDAVFRNVRVSNNSINNPRSRPTEIDLGNSSGYIRNPVRGNITFDGLTVENSRWSGIWTKKTLESYHVKLKNAIFRDVSKGRTKAAIHIGLLGYGNSSYANMGGFTFENVLIDYDGNAPSVTLHGPSHTNWNLKDMRGTIKVESPRGVRLNDTQDILSRGSSSVNFSIVEN